MEEKRRRRRLQSSTPMVLGSLGAAESPEMEKIAGAEAEGASSFIRCRGPRLQRKAPQERADDGGSSRQHEQSEQHRRSQDLAGIAAGLYISIVSIIFCCSMLIFYNFYILLATFYTIFGG